MRNERTRWVCRVGVGLGLAIPGGSAAASPMHTVATTAHVNVRAGPSAVESRHAFIRPGTIVRAAIDDAVPGRGCDDGWVELDAGGWVCGSYLEASSGVPKQWPSGPLPFRYVHPPGRKAFSYAVSGVTEEDGERMFFRGEATFAANRYDEHEPSDLKGLDLRGAAGDGTKPAIVVDDGAGLYASAGDSEPAAKLSRYTKLWLGPGTTRADGSLVHRVLGPPGAPEGYVLEEDGVRLWHDEAAPEEVGPDEIWVDIDIEQQMLAVRKGDALQYVTLISGGTADRPTPPGDYRIRDKRDHTTMASSKRSADKYYIEAIPWTMYFAPHYAIHGAYWHDEFGNPRSHGCVNLAPRDAAAVYRMVPPRSHPAFARTFPDDEHPGAFVRVRDGASP